MASSHFMTMVMLQLQLIVLVAAGFFLSKKGTITAAGRKCMLDVLINYILPCNIICSFQIEMTREILGSCSTVLVLTCLVQAFYLLASRVLYPGETEKRLACLRYGTVCSNAGFLGLPVVTGFYGAMGTLLTSVALIPQRVVMWSAGLSLFTHADGKDVIKKVITHPCIVAVYIGFALMFLGNPTLPAFLQKTLDCSSASMLCVSMLCIGGILAEAGRVQIDKTLIWYTFVRLLLIPLVVFLALSALHVEEMVVGTMVLLSGMPTGSMTAVLASKYDQDAAFASSMVCVTTVASIVTLPVLCLLL